MLRAVSRAPIYRLGLPAWAFPGWQGRYFDADPSPLASYARVFSCVEGNTTFYRVPDPASVAQWRHALDGRDFHVCFKLPRSVTHERRPDRDDLQAFLRAVQPLEAHLGPLLLQLPATADGAALERLAPVFEAVTERHRAVLEVRHPEFFERPELLEPTLERFELGRVVLDSRALYAGDHDHPEVREALHEKPDVPVRPEARQGLVFVRLVLHPDPAGNTEYLEAWAEDCARFIGDGQRVYMMIHCPNNQHCPAFAERFHELLGERLEALGPLPPWPVPQQSTLL